MRVAIVGAGPAGSALAIFLARQGAEVTLFDDGRRPELLVGESLVPAVVPILQRLGLEGDTTQCGRVKPGVTFVWSPTTRFSFTFARFAPSVFPYAYNIARPQFDDAIVAKAVAAGVHRVITRARLAPAGSATAGGPPPGSRPAAASNWFSPTLVSRQPIAPQRQRSPRLSTITWPTSPAKPIDPRSGTPPMKKPPPIPTLPVM